MADGHDPGVGQTSRLCANTDEGIQPVPQEQATQESSMILAILGKEEGWGGLSVQVYTCSNKTILQDPETYSTGLVTLFP